MGIKGIITLLAVGGLAGAGYYFRDGIKDTFATTKGSISNVKDTLQAGAGYSNPVTGGNENSDFNNSKQNSKYEAKNDDQQFIYVPIYQNNGQQSNQDSKQERTNSRKPNPAIQKYNSDSRNETNDSISEWTNPSDRENLAAYEKRKYGINHESLEKAVTKSPSKRTITEKKQIEAEKARAKIWDSREINNW